MKTPKLVTLKIGDITPYENNPRTISDENVDKVADSIERYGYVQPIVVDKNNVIIVGHTRLKALKKLKYKKVGVYVSDLPEDKVREYRLIDNKTGEMSSWDFDALVLELREFGDDLLLDYFPDVDLEIGMLDAAKDQISDSDVAGATKKINTLRPDDAEKSHTTDVECPSCFHVFQVRTRSLPGLTHEDLEDLTNGETE